MTKTNKKGYTQVNTKGKFISILGDSISTYIDVSHGAAADSTNSTIRHNDLYYHEGRWGITRADTWWQQAIDRLGLTLLVNNSWSGSCVFQTWHGTVGAYVDRCVQLHADVGAHAGQDPDLIAVFMGTNDFTFFGGMLGTHEIDYDALCVKNDDGTYTYAEPATVCEAYAVMLCKIRQRYPDAHVFCLNLLPRREGNGQPTAFNDSLAQIVARFGCTTVDLFGAGVPTDGVEFDRYFPDGRVHPNALGMDVISDCLVKTVVQN